MPDNIWVDKYLATFTTSPKLTTNGDPEANTYKPEVLKWHKNNRSGFKFVINKSSDINEIWEKYVTDNKEINLPLDRIWLMPVAGSREEHITNAPAVAEYAKALNVKFSSPFSVCPEVEVKVMSLLSAAFVTLSTGRLVRLPPSPANEPVILRLPVGIRNIDPVSTLYAISSACL